MSHEQVWLERVRQMKHRGVHSTLLKVIVVYDSILQCGFVQSVIHAMDSVDLECGTACRSWFCVIVGNLWQICAKCIDAVYRTAYTIHCTVGYCVYAICTISYCVMP
jgi:hypothetical protein